MTNSYRTEGDVSIVMKWGTFLMHYDIYALDLLATLATLLQNIGAHGLFPV
jgi:hypothetical protein